LQTVQMLMNEAGTQRDASQAVQDWANRAQIEAVAEFSRSFPSDLAGVCCETSFSYLLQLLQMANSPLNRLLKLLGGR
jgi:hypothetical protein